MKQKAASGQIYGPVFIAVRTAQLSAAQILHRLLGAENIPDEKPDQHREKITKVESFTSTQQEKTKSSSHRRCRTEKSDRHQEKIIKNEIFQLNGAQKNEKTGHASGQKRRKAGSSRRSWQDRAQAADRGSMGMSWPPVRRELHNDSLL